MLIRLRFGRTQFSAVSVEENQSFPAQEHVDRFLCWLDYCDELVQNAPEVITEDILSCRITCIINITCTFSVRLCVQVLAVKVARALQEQWLKGVVQPQLLQM